MDVWINIRGFAHRAEYTQKRLEIRILCIEPKGLHGLLPSRHNSPFGPTKEMGFRVS